MRDCQLNTYSNQQGQDLIAANLYWLNTSLYKKCFILNFIYNVLDNQHMVKLNSITI